MSTGFDSWVRKIPWRRKWQSSPALLPGKSHGLRSLIGYSPRGRKESDTTERLHFHFYFQADYKLEWNCLILLNTEFFTSKLHWCRIRIWFSPCLKNKVFFFFLEYCSYLIKSCKKLWKVLLLYLSGNLPEKQRFYVLPAYSFLTILRS